MSTPKRIQRKRTKGWRMPEGAIYVGRPSRWGNPYFIYSEEIVLGPAGDDWYRPLESGGARAAAVDLYRDWLAYHPDVIEAARVALAGLDLACWCPPDQPCHADVLLELANA